MTLSALSPAHDSIAMFGCNMPLHPSSVYFDIDIYGHGRPTGRAFLPDGVDPRAEHGALPNAEKINMEILGEPWFKHDDHARVDPYIEAVRKVAANFKELEPINDTGPVMGGVALSKRRKQRNGDADLRNSAVF